MDINSIVELASIGLSAVALLIALIRKGKKKEYTIEELANKVNSKVRKYIDKQCKKNNIDLNDLMDVTSKNILKGLEEIDGESTSIEK